MQLLLLPTDPGTPLRVPLDRGPVVDHHEHRGTTGRSGDPSNGVVVDLRVPFDPVGPDPASLPARGEDRGGAAADLADESGGESDLRPRPSDQPALPPPCGGGARRVDVPAPEFAVEDPDLVGDGREDRRPGDGHGRLLRRGLLRARRRALRTARHGCGRLGLRELLELPLKGLESECKVRVRALEPPDLLLRLRELPPPGLGRVPGMSDVLDRADGAEDTVPRPRQGAGREVEVLELAVGHAELSLELAIVPEVGLGRERSPADLLEVGDRGRVGDQELAGPARGDHPHREGLEHGLEQGPVPLGLAEEGPQAFDLLGWVLVRSPLLVNPDADWASVPVLAGDGPVHDPAEIAGPGYDPAAEGAGDRAVAEDRVAEPVAVVGMAAPDQQGRVVHVRLRRVPGEVLARRRDVLAVAVGADPCLEVGGGVDHPGEEATPAPFGGRPLDPRRPLGHIPVDPSRADADRPLGVLQGGQTGVGVQDHVVPVEVRLPAVSVVDLDAAPLEFAQEGQQPFVRTDGEEAGHGNGTSSRCRWISAGSDKRSEMFSSRHGKGKITGKTTLFRHDRQRPDP